MIDIGMPILFALLLWWVSTGVILYLDGLPARTYRWSLAMATLLLLAAGLGIVATRGRADVLAAYCAFSCALIVWGWLEMSYYMGFITGPRKHPCPPGARTWQRFSLALQTSLYHELLIVGFGAALLGITAGYPNRTAAWSFVVFWLMRWSAKLNIFFGVRNLNEEWLPERLRFLTSYMARRPFNWLLPFSVVGASLVAVILYLLIVAAAPGSFTAVSLTLIATLLVLAIVEHGLLVLPLRAEVIWSWGFRSHRATNAALRDGGQP